MAVYKFRVTFEEYEEISRDIEIRSVQTFEDLHRSIQNSINFDGAHRASFFMSDDYWKKGQEICTEEKVYEKNGETKKIPLAKKSRLCDFIIDPHQKIYYIYDPKTEWGFFIELIKIILDEAGVSYPRVVKTSGDAPKQYGASALGKVSSDFDFLNESGIETEEDEGDETLSAETETGEAEEEESGEAEGGEVNEFGAGEDYQDER